MQQTRPFQNVKFTQTTFREVVGVINELLGEFYKLEPKDSADRISDGDADRYEPYAQDAFSSIENLRITQQGSRWRFDSFEEWIAEYNQDCLGASFTLHQHEFSLSVDFYAETSPYTSISFEAPTKAALLRVMNIFSAAEATSRLPEPPPLPALPTPKKPPVHVFIGHGGSRDWRDIKDHLQDKQGYTVEAYETGTRSGHTIRDILQSMMQNSTFAVLVMTGEDQTSNGDTRARQNVVHEMGLFQGKLGSNRAVAVVEEGVEVFSNLDGIQQIRYKRGHIDSVYGEILATIRREFGDAR